MNSPNKPAITHILHSLNGMSTNTVESAIDGYLQYYDQEQQKSLDDVLNADAVERHKKDAVSMATTYYNLTTDFYEYCWGESIHHAIFKPDESPEHSVAKSEYYLAVKLGLKPGDTVLDVGCGIGGPACHIAALFEANVIGLNINDYQLSRARTLTEKAKLDHLVSYVKADFHHMPFDDGHFEKVYAIESTFYSPSLYEVYSEVFRVLKPGGLFALYECIQTNKYNPTDPYHRKLKAQLAEGFGAFEHETRTETLVLSAARQAGFEVLESRDRALEPGLPWYSPFQAHWSLSNIMATRLGRWASYVMFYVLETARVIPRGTSKVARVLRKGLDGLERSGAEGIFSPMYLLVLRKPSN